MPVPVCLCLLTLTGCGSSVDPARVQEAEELTDVLQEKNKQSSSISLAPDPDTENRYTGKATISEHEYEITVKVEDSLVSWHTSQLTMEEKMPDGGIAKSTVGPHRGKFEHKSN